MTKLREATPRRRIQRMYDPEIEQDEIKQIRQALRRERFGRDQRVKRSCRVLVAIVILALPLGAAKELWPGWWWMVVGAIWFVVTVALFSVLAREVQG